MGGRVSRGGVRTIGEHAHATNPPCATQAPAAGALSVHAHPRLIQRMDGALRLDGGRAVRPTPVQDTSHIRPGSVQEVGSSLRGKISHRPCTVKRCRLPGQVAKPATPLASGPLKFSPPEPDAHFMSQREAKCGRMRRNYSARYAPHMCGRRSGLLTRGVRRSWFCEVR